MKQLNLLSYIDKINPPVTKPKDKRMEVNIKLRKYLYLTT